jgi:hypothetical protein
LLRGGGALAQVCTHNTNIAAQIGEVSSKTCQTAFAKANATVSKDTLHYNSVKLLALDATSHHLLL